MEEGSRLLLSLLGPDGPRLWLRDADGTRGGPPRLLPARPGDLELLAALAVPAAARRRAGTVGARTREEVLGTFDRTPWARGVDLDARMGKDPSTRSRRVAALKAVLEQAGLEPERVLVASAPGVLELHGVAVDLVEVVRCAREERWAEGAALLRLAGDGQPGPPAALTEPEARAVVEEAIAAVRERTSGTAEVPPARIRRRPRPRPRPRRAAALVALALALVGAGVALGALLDPEHRAGRVDAAAVTAPRPVTLTVDNRVTDGLGMREDTSPVALTTRPVPYCGVLRCNIRGTERGSGGTYAGAVCRTSGSYVTNGNDSSSADADDDDRNPELVRTTGYYGVRTAGGTFGFVSEAWIVRRQRGGLGLPRCPGDAELRPGPAG